MTIWSCYLIALFPLFAAAFLWFFWKRFVWFEALGLAASGFIVSTIFYFCVSAGMYDDIQTISGQVIGANHYSPWLEYYEYAVYRTEYYWTTESYTTTDSKGRSHTHHHRVQKSREVFDHWQPTTEQHTDSWDCSDTLVGSYGIDGNRFEDIHKKFGGLVSVPGQRTTGQHHSHMISGDLNDYQVQNKNSYVYPVTDIRHWENHVKACPSVFSYAKVPDGVKVFDYPANQNKFSSDRLCGPVGISLEKWDSLNSALGPNKKINLIMCAFGTDSEQDMGHYQEESWIGGKKNDIVITYGGGTATKPSWCYVFGWSESDLVKLNIESIILKKGINDNILPDIKEEVIANYTIKDWHKFDYLKAEIPFSTFIWLIIIMLAVVAVCIVISAFVDIEKDDGEDSFALDGLLHPNRKSRNTIKSRYNKYNYNKWKYK